MACRSSLVAEQLICVLTLRFNLQKVCPITMLHIAGDQHSMTDISSRSFGSEHKWHFKSEHGLLTFFNCNFTLPSQNSWTVCQPTSAIAMRVISVLRMTPFTLDDWRRLPAAGKNIGITGKSTRLLWEWTLTFRVPTSKSGSDSYPVLQHYGNGEQVQNCIVSSAIMAVGQTIALACDSNPTKVVGSERLLPRLQIMLDGYRKVGPATRKESPRPIQRPRTPCQNGVPTRDNSTPSSNCGSDNGRVGEYTVL